MRAHHDDLIGVVASCNLADDVEGIQILGIEPVVDVQFKGDWDVLFNVAREQTIVLSCKNELRRHWWCINRTVPDTLNKRSATGTSDTASPCGRAAALFDDGEDAFLHEKLVPLLLIELLGLAAWLPS